MDYYIYFCLTVKSNTTHGCHYCRRIYLSFRSTFSLVLVFVGLMWHNLSLSCCLLWIIVCLFDLFLSAIVLSLVDLQLITHRNRTLFYRVGYNLVKLTSSGYVRYAYYNICHKTGDVNECLVFEECQTAIPVLNEQLFLIVRCCC